MSMMMMMMMNGDDLIFADCRTFRLTFQEQLKPREGVRTISLYKACALCCNPHSLLSLSFCSKSSAMPFRPYHLNPDQIRRIHPILFAIICTYRSDPMYTEFEQVHGK